jgi:hypothetical protein
VIIVEGCSDGQISSIRCAVVSVPCPRLLCYDVSSVQSSPWLVIVSTLPFSKFAFPYSSVSFGRRDPLVLLLVQGYAKFLGGEIMRGNMTGKGRGKRITKEEERGGKVGKRWKGRTSRSETVLASDSDTIHMPRLTSRWSERVST